MKTLLRADANTHNLIVHGALGYHVQGCRGNVALEDVKGQRLADLDAKRSAADVHVILPKGWMRVPHKEPHSVVKLLRAYGLKGGPQAGVISEGCDLLIGVLTPTLVIGAMVI